MREMRLLTSAREMRAAIRHVLAPERRQRVVAVAFIGSDALRFLPNPRGIEIYCWPKAGGTNPYAVKQLLQAGAIVKFVEHLHMKLYSSADGGAVIGSANLTDNALGEGGLIECGISIGKGFVDGHALLKKLSIVRDFDARLRRLYKEHVAFYQNNPLSKTSKRGGTTVGRRPSIPFMRWYEGGASKQPWRWGWYTEDGFAPSDATSRLADETGSVKYWRFLSVKRRNTLTPDEFTLNLLVQEMANGKVKIRHPAWWVPQICIKSYSKSWSEYPFLWFAQKAPSVDLRAPFDERDPTFIKALRKTIDDFGGIDVVYTEPSVPKPTFLQAIANHYHSLSDRSSKH
jgi:hypothetical protein